MDSRLHGKSKLRTLLLRPSFVVTRLVHLVVPRVGVGSSSYIDWFCLDPADKPRDDRVGEMMIRQIENVVNDYKHVIGVFSIRDIIYDLI